MCFLFEVKCCAIITSSNKVFIVDDFINHFNNRTIINIICSISALFDSIETLMWYAMILYESTLLIVWRIEQQFTSYTHCTVLNSFGHFLYTTITHSLRYVYTNIDVRYAIMRMCLYVCAYHVLKYKCLVYNTRTYTYKHKQSLHRYLFVFDINGLRHWLTRTAFGRAACACVAHSAVVKYLYVRN